MPEKVLLERNLLLIFALGIFVLSFMIIQPLLTPILTGCILAYLFYPIYLTILNLKYFKKRESLGQKFSAMVVVFLIILLLVAPILLFLSLLIMNAHNIANFLGYLGPATADTVNKLVEILNEKALNDIGFTLHIGDNITQVISSITSGLLRIIQITVTQIPQLLLGSLISLFIVYYLIKNAHAVIGLIETIVPLPKQKLNNIMERFNRLCRGMISSQFVIAVIQGFLVGFSCLILGIHEHLLLLSLLTIILAIIPFMGAIVVWVGIAIYLFSHALTHELPIWQPVFMVIFGIFVISMVDNFIRPKMMSEAANINPAVVLIGFIGGFMLFGLPGVLIGPMILTLTEVALELFKEIQKKS